MQMIDVDRYIADLESSLGIELICYVREEDTVLGNGEALIESLEEDDENGVERDLVPYAEAKLTNAQHERLVEAQEFLGAEIIGYHRGADAVVHNSELVLNLCERYHLDDKGRL